MYRGISLAGVCDSETDVGIKPTVAQVGVAGMVDASFWKNTEFTAVSSWSEAPSHGPMEE